MEDSVDYVPLFVAVSKNVSGLSMGSFSFRALSILISKGYCTAQREASEQGAKETSAFGWERNSAAGSGLRGFTPLISHLSAN